MVGWLVPSCQLLVRIINKKVKAKKDQENFKKVVTKMFLIHPENKKKILNHNKTDKKTLNKPLNFNVK